MATATREYVHMTTGRVYSSRDRMNILFFLPIGDGIGNNIFPGADSDSKRQPVKATILDRLREVIETELPFWGPVDEMSLTLTNTGPGEYSFTVYCLK